MRTIRPSVLLRECRRTHQQGLESVLQDLESAGYDSTGIFSVKKLAHLTKGNASSFLPTPATPYGNNQGEQQGGQTRHSLESMAKHDLWPTPTLHGNYNRIGVRIWDGLRQRSRRIYGRPQQQRRDQEPTQRLEGAWTEQGREELANPTVHYDSMYVNKSPNKEKRHSNGLATQVDQLQKNWPTPSTRDHKGVTRGRIRNGKVSMDTLTAVQHRQQGSDIWDIEPNVGRVAHGITDRVDRLRLLGNGVVPKQPPEHGRS